MNTNTITALNKRISASSNRVLNYGYEMPKDFIRYEIGKYFYEWDMSTNKVTRYSKCDGIQLGNNISYNTLDKDMTDPSIVGYVENWVFYPGK